MNFRDSLVIDIPASVAALREAIKAALTPEILSDMVDRADLTAELEEFLVTGDQVINFTVELSSG